MPIIVDKRVAKMVGKMMLEGSFEPSELLNASTDEGISCTLVAFITKNIAIAYSVLLYFSNS